MKNTAKYLIWLCIITLSSTRGNTEALVSLEDCQLHQFTSQQGKSLTACLVQQTDDSLTIQAYKYDGSTTSKTYAKEQFSQITALSDSVSREYKSLLKTPTPQYALAVPARFEMSSGRVRRALFFTMKNDSVVLGTPGSGGSFNTLQVPKSTFSAITLRSGTRINLDSSSYTLTPQDTISPPSEPMLATEENQTDSLTDSPNDSLNDSLATTLSDSNMRFITIRDTIILPPDTVLLCKDSARSPASVYVSTDPEGAHVYVNNERVPGQTPLTILRYDPDTLNIRTQWLVDDNIWAGQKQVLAQPGDSLRVFIKMKRTRPTLSVMTYPDKAEIYLNDSIGAYNFPTVFSHVQFTDVLPGLYPLTIFKAGYRDTTIEVQIHPLEPNKIEAFLIPLRDAKEISRQQEFLKLRKRHFIGEVVLWSSIGPAVLSGVFYYLAKNAEEKARSTKEELQYPGVRTGENFLRLQAENRDYYETGKHYRNLSLISAGLASIGATVGVLLYF